MKVVINILCWILVVFCIYFPFSYFHKDMDKKEVKISHILVETQEKALDIQKEIKEGKSFEELAEKHSLCPSKKRKGDIGYNMRGRLYPEFEKTAFKLNRKEVSDPVKTEEGWHLIKIYDIKYFSDKENFIQKKF